MPRCWVARVPAADGQWLGYQRDNPEITSLQECRYYVAEAERFTAKAQIGRYQFRPMTVAQVAIRSSIGCWLPRSGFVPDDHPGFEAWMGRPFAHGTEHFELAVQLPIRR